MRFFASLRMTNYHSAADYLCFIMLSPFSPVMLSEAKHLGIEGNITCVSRILRCAQNDKLQYFLIKKAVTVITTD